MIQQVLLSIVAIIMIYLSIAYSIVILSNAWKMAKVVVRKFPVYIRQALF